MQTDIISHLPHSVKLSASIRRLMPNLQDCNRSVVAMKAALSEMVTIASHLSTHEDARDGEGIRREEGDVGEDREEEEEEVERN